MILCRPLYKNPSTCCTSYYEDYKLDYTGIVVRKWHDRDNIILIENNRDRVELSSGLSEELVNNAGVDDTVIKKGSSMICTLKTKNKTMILPYVHTTPGCNCPDTNKLK